MRKKITMICLMIMLAACTLFAGTMPKITNIAPGKAVKASGTFSAQYAPENINDGNPDTAWGSTANTSPQWIYIDLGTMTDITGFTIQWVMDYYSRNFGVFTSADGHSWKKIYENKGIPSMNRNYYVGDRCRYIGIYLTEPNKNAFGIKEFKVFHGIPHQPVEFGCTALFDACYDILTNYVKLYKTERIINAADMLNIVYLEIDDTIRLTSVRGMEHAYFLRSFNAAKQDITDISPLCDLPMLEWLTMPENRISFLPDISGLTAIYSIDLRDNALLTIAEQGNNYTLKTLNLTNNQLTTIDPLVHLTNLELLYLNDNALTTIPAGLATGSPRLRTLTLKNNRLTNIDTVRNLGSLKLLDLESNMIETIPPSVFTGCDTLDTLNLNHNRLTTISGVTNLKNLRYLWLNNNALTACNEVTGLATMILLDVSHNALTTIPDLSINTNLGELNLSYNTLTTLEGLGHKTNLATLYASNNMITNLIGLKDVSGITNLDLSHNKLTTVTELSNALNNSVHDIILHHNAIEDMSPLSGIVSYYRLDLSYNQLSNCRALTAVTTCSDIDLSHNRITSLDGLENLTYVTYHFDMASNPLTDITAFSIVDSHPKLIVDFFDTDITDLTPLAGLTGLKGLDISGTNVTDLSPLTGLTYLSHLEISNTQITDLSPLSKSIHSINTFTAWQSALTDIAQVANMLSLKHLNMGSTPVGDITPLSVLSSLNHVELDHCLLTDISPLTGLDLEYLDISNNQVKDLTPIASQVNMQTLNVEHNEMIIMNDTGQGTINLDVINALLAGGAAVSYIPGNITE